MPEKDATVKRLIQEADAARFAADEALQNQGRDKLNTTLKAWGLPWIAKFDELCVPGTEVVLTAPESSTGLRAAFSCPLCKEPIVQIIYSVEQLGVVLATENGLGPLPRLHLCDAKAKAKAYAELIDPREAVKIIRYCEDLRSEIMGQARGLLSNEAADHLLDLKLRTMEIEATIRAGFARGGDAR